MRACLVLALGALCVVCGAGGAGGEGGAGGAGGEGGAGGAGDAGGAGGAGSAGGEGGAGGAGVAGGAGGEGDAGGAGGESGESGAGVAGGAGGEGGAGGTTPDVSAKWLEDFRRRLVTDSYDYGPPPARPTSIDTTTDGRRDGALLRDTYGLNSKDKVVADDMASRENGISRRDLARAGAPQRPRDASLVYGEIDSHRKAFLKSIFELEDQLEPKYLQRKEQTDARNQSSHGLNKSRKRNEDKEKEKPSYIEENGVKRYRVRMDDKQMLRNQFNDGLAWMDDVETHEFSDVEDRLYRNEGTEDRPHDQNDNYGRLPYNHGRSLYRNDGYEGNNLHYSDSQNVQQSNAQGGNIKQHQSSKDENSVQFRARDGQSAESRYQEDRSSSSSEESASGVSVEQTRELEVSESKQEDVESRHEEWRRRGGRGEARVAQHYEEGPGDRQASR